MASASSLSKLLALGAVALAAAPGCARPAAGQAPVKPATPFADFPTVGILDGKTQLNPILGPVKAAGSRSFTVPRRAGYQLWIACAGTGDVKITSNDDFLGWGRPCDSGGTVVGYTDDPAHLAPGQKLTLRITAPAGATWMFGVDAARS
jgi:hypothetical protein